MSRQAITAPEDCLDEHSWIQANKRVPGLRARQVQPGRGSRRIDYAYYLVLVAGGLIIWLEMVR